MIESHKSLALLGVLVLCSAPAVAWIPQVGLQISGAAMIGPHEYIAAETQAVTLAFSSNPGDLMWVFAAAVDKNGKPDYSNVLTLLFDKNSADGKLLGTFDVPKGLAGQSFLIVAASLSVDGDLQSDAALIHIQAELPPADVLQDIATSDGG